jgi:hypothetical protein
MENIPGFGFGKIDIWPFAETSAAVRFMPGICGILHVSQTEVYPG